MSLYQYKYKNKDCENIIYLFKKFKNRNNCPVCSLCNLKTERLISTSSFIFKGTGFYENDYKKKDKGNN